MALQLIRKIITKLGGVPMEYSVFDDFEHYINENYELIQYLEAKESILNDFVGNVIKALRFLINLKHQEGKALDLEDEMIFTYGFDFLFENVEQLKLYLKLFDGDYERLEKKSLYIRFVFELEELKVEIEKREEKPEGYEEDLKLMNELLDYFEGLIEAEKEVENQLKEDLDFERKVMQFYSLFKKYDDVVLITDAFKAYCASYGI